MLLRYFFFTSLHLTLQVQKGFHSLQNAIVASKKRTGKTRQCSHATSQLQQPMGGFSRLPCALSTPLHWRPLTRLFQGFPSMTGVSDPPTSPEHLPNGPLLTRESPPPPPPPPNDETLRPWRLKRGSEGVLQVFSRGLTAPAAPLDSKKLLSPLSLPCTLPTPAPARCSREVRRRRQRELQERFGDAYTTLRSSGTTRRGPDSRPRTGCRWTFVFDPAGRFLHWWSFVVSLAFLYNFWFIIYRYSFDEIRPDTIHIWFPLDYTADLVYIADIAVCFRTGYLEDGVLQTDVRRMRMHYMNSTKFYIDCLCMLPLDFLYLSVGFKSMVRVFRLVKMYKFWQFSDRVERHTNYPNVMRAIKLLHYLLAIVHWNACLFKLVADAVRHGSTASMDGHLGSGMDDRGCGSRDITEGSGQRDWKVPHFNSTGETYLYALYWSCLTLSLMGDLPKPESVGAYVFVIFEVLFGLLLFATVLGHSSNIVSNVSAARKDFQSE